MVVRLSASFYKATIDKFSKVADDPLAFPILLSFLEKAAQSSALLHSAKSVIANDQKFSNFYEKTRDNLPPEMAKIIEKQEEKIREKLMPAVKAEMSGEMRVHDLETELRVRKEYEARADRKEQEQERFKRAVIGTMIQLEFKTHQKVDAIKSQHDAFIEDAKKQAKSDRKHRNVAYAISAISLAVGVAGVAVGLPGVVDKLMGKKPETKSNNSSLQVRLASSGQCLPSDIKVEISKDGTATLPSSGSVCLVVPDDAAPNSKREPTSPFVLPYSDPCAPFTGKSMFDILNDGGTVRLFKEDGSSICLHMPKILPDVPAKKPDTTAHKEQGKTGPTNRPAQAPKSKQHQRKRCP